MADNGRKQKKRINIRFKPSGFNVYEKEVIFDNQKFNIKMDVKPHRPISPTVEIDSRFLKKEDD